VWFAWRGRNGTGPRADNNKALTVWTEENLNSQYKKEKAKFSNKNDAVKMA
jgi:hypothetical protein